MTRTALLGLILCVLSLNLSGQGAYPTVNHTYHAGTKTMSYSLNNADPSWAAFYFFGDGNFTLQHHPVHEYKQAIIHDTEVYVARAKKPTLPGRVHTIPTTGLNMTSNMPGTTRAYRFPRSTTQPTQLSPVKVGTSWGALSDTNLILIVSFMHPGTHNSPILAGSIELNFDSQILVHRNVTPAPNSAAYGWVHNFSVNTAGSINSVGWDFDHLMPGEIRHAYVEVEFPGSLADTRTPINVTMEWEDILGHNSAHHGISVGVARNPRDPNFIEVNHDQITPHHPQTQKLEYEVGFYNDGTWYAKDVIVDVTVDVEESAGAITARYIESSFPCTMTMLADDKLRFTFNDIYLPGINQDTSFTKDQCSGYLKFSICAYNDLEQHKLILADALIYFDNLAPIATGQDTTMVTYEAPAVPECDDDQIVSWSDQTGGIFAEASDKQVSNAYPNPFSDQLNISYEVVEDHGSDVSINLYSVSGQQHHLLRSAHETKGIHRFGFDSSHLPAGIYLLEILNGTDRTTQRLIKVK